VFSDPPLNTLTIRKSGDVAALSTGGQVRTTGALSSIPDGDYTVGFRAHHLSLESSGGHEITIPAMVSVAEITGSESYVHMESGEHRFVALMAGVRRLEPGASVTAYLDPRHLFLFDATGRLAAASPAQKAA
jgi:glycerol transport system ATP-binding protein